MNDLHLFVFCASKYKDIFLKPCLLSLERNLKDKVASYNIVTDKKFQLDGFNVIQDEEIWEIIDPKFKNSNLYKNFWLKQQILKLSCDTIKDGNLLIVDVDLFFLKPVKFIENNKFNFYMAHEYFRPYFTTNYYLLDIKKYTRSSFVSDFIIFNADVLKEIKEYVENKFNNNWINVVQKRTNQVNPNGFSEYELYGNYLLKHHPELVNDLIEPIDYKMWLFLYAKDRPENLEEVKTDPEKFLEYVHSRSENYYQSVSLHKVFS